MMCLKQWASLSSQAVYKGVTSGSTIYTLLSTNLSSGCSCCCLWCWKYWQLSWYFCEFIYVRSYNVNLGFRHRTFSLYCYLSEFDSVTYYTYYSVMFFSILWHLIRKDMDVDEDKRLFNIKLMSNTMPFKAHRGRDRTAVWITTTCAISAYHH